MGYHKSLEYSKVFNALLCDVQTLHSNVFTPTDLKHTLKKVHSRISCEGLSFLTKTLPRLGKGLDKALAEGEPLNAAKLAFSSLPSSQLPRFLGELFEMVLDKTGRVLPNANVACVKSLRDICYAFYKLEIPCDDKLEQNVINKFVKTEDEVRTYSNALLELAQAAVTDSGTIPHRLPFPTREELPLWFRKTIRQARTRLNRLFASFDPKEIFPRHGPGAVSTGECAEAKYTFRNVPNRITETYPLDEYFFASAGHICDVYKDLASLTTKESSAKVILVPKDSRGPRLISCEPLEFQWIQQGLSKAIVRLVEHHPLTREAVRFTDQEPNRMAAKYGSSNGEYATLDLNEASDRVSLGLVHLLFPEPVLTALLATRSLSTRLPDGRVLNLHKFAPMGSALCFPVLALTVWSLLSAGLDVLDTDGLSNKTVYVYGDDVIVPTALAEHAMIILESFGLKINRDKSCTKGFFRESCGMDAFKGECVTPVRFRTTWSSSQCPESYVSWISYANSCWDKKYVQCYDYIVDRLLDLYGPIPDRSYGLTVPSLAVVSEQPQAIRKRTNKDLQKSEYRVLDVKPVSITRVIDGWKMLLRFFSEANSGYELVRHTSPREIRGGSVCTEPFSVSVYTKRRAIKLVRRWR